jgi:DedD protein
MIIETAEPEPRPAASAAPAMPVMPATPVVAVQATAAAPAPASKELAPPAVPKASAPAVAAAPEAPGRFVVQVGAFSDDATVRQTRQKVEKLGLKTYTQEVSTDGGKRVRVRVGPFASRDEAAQVLNKLKGSGLPGALLAL